MQLMLQATVCDCLALDPFAFEGDGLSAKFGPLFAENCIVDAHGRRRNAREMLVSQRTQLLNGLRGHLTEIGVIAAQGPRHARELAELIEAWAHVLRSGRLPDRRL